VTGKRAKTGCSGHDSGSVADAEDLQSVPCPGLHDPFTTGCRKGLHEAGWAAIAPIAAALDLAIRRLTADEPRLALDEATVAAAAVGLVPAEALTAARTALAFVRTVQTGTVVPALPLRARPATALRARTVASLTRARTSRQAAASLHAGVEDAAGR
jgi:hypothetical protein